MVQTGTHSQNTHIARTFLALAGSALGQNHRSRGFQLPGGGPGLGPSLPSAPLGARRGPGGSRGGAEPAAGGPSPGAVRGPGGGPEGLGAGQAGGRGGVPPSLALPGKVSRCCRAQPRLLLLLPRPGGGDCAPTSARAASPRPPARQHGHHSHLHPLHRRLPAIRGARQVRPARHPPRPPTLSPPPGRYAAPRPASRPCTGRCSAPSARPTPSLSRLLPPGSPCPQLPAPQPPPRHAAAAQAAAHRAAAGTAAPRTAAPRPLLGALQPRPSLTLQAPPILTPSARRAPSSPC